MILRCLLALVLAAALSNVDAQMFPPPPDPIPLPAPKDAGPERSDATDPKREPEEVQIELEGDAVRMPTETFSLPPPPEEKPAPPAKGKKKKTAAPSGG